MKVWWCEEHNCTGETEDRCVAWVWESDAHNVRGVGAFDYGDCRMVEMQLVPTDARVETQCPNCKFVYESADV